MWYCLVNEIWSTGWVEIIKERQSLSQIQCHKRVYSWWPTVFQLEVQLESSYSRDIIWTYQDACINFSGAHFAWVVELKCSLKAASCRAHCSNPHLKWPNTSDHEKRWTIGALDDSVQRTYWLPLPFAPWPGRWVQNKCTSPWCNSIQSQRSKINRTRQFACS